MSTKGGRLLSDKNRENRFFTTEMTSMIDYFVITILELAFIILSSGSSSGSRLNQTEEEMFKDFEYTSPWAKEILKKPNVPKIEEEEEEEEVESDSVPQQRNVEQQSSQPQNTPPTPNTRKEDQNSQTQEENPESPAREEAPISSEPGPVPKPQTETPRAEGVTAPTEGDSEKTWAKEIWEQIKECFDC